jgi:hypothetical protein
MLVKFESSRGPIWVNPVAISAIRGSGTGTDVFLIGEADPIAVDGDPEAIVVMVNTELDLG